MLSALDAVRLAASTGAVGATAALTRAKKELPASPGSRNASAILNALIERNRYEAEPARKEIEALVGRSLEGDWPDAPEAREAITAAAAPLLAPGSFEALTFAFGLAWADLYVATRTADGIGMVLDLVAGAGAGADALADRFREALAAIEAAKVRLAAAGAAFEKALAGIRLSPAVGLGARKLVSRAERPLPVFDGPKSRQLFDVQAFLPRAFGPPGEMWWRGLLEEVQAFERTFSFPPEPESPALPSPAEANALLELLARPDDDEARLRWAGLAEAREEPRAVLVMEQLIVRERLRKPPHYPRFESPVALSMLERHPEWADPVRRLGAKDVAFRRGFVEWLSIDAWVFLGRATALYAAAPILHLKLLGVGPLLSHLLTSGALARLVSLDLSKQELDDGHVEELARATGLTSLRGLDLRSNRITVAGARALYTSTALANLVYAPLDGNPCGPLYEENREPWEDGIPNEPWLTTPLGDELSREHGKRRWAFPWASSWPPDLDVLTVAR